MSKRTLLTYYSSSSNANTSNTDEGTTQPKKSKVEFRFSDIVGDLGNRKPIDHYAFEIRDQVKRAYALSGPTQPVNHTFPRRWQSGEWRSFQKIWFEKHDWLEYSVSKDAAFCLYCYLFFEPGKPEKFGSDVFAKSGYVNWKKALHTFERHGNCKTHNNARLKCDDFMNQRTSVTHKFINTSKEDEIRYKIRLTSSLDVARYLIEQGDAFRGHDESNTSINKGKFREMIDWYKNKKKKVKDAYEKGSTRCQMISHHIQKNLTKACARRVMAVIMDEIGDRNFSVLIDESRDVSIKEQMAVILRFVNDQGKVMERFLGLQHVNRCIAAALKETLIASHED
ncbi:uncharacterized protein LOC133917884 [Phragmites australis]|uniref:uncharacterized protein LOC133917884 n=1 Tax=Phragmites australis TaxID=29695 RepID=UPI002D788FA2|nr:uncharacterized protein LOC133917884 [Phragmites australis]